ncbi:MAG: hypothetical protein CMJ32_06015 [Phycisphaerae bacterium]|nr:hypothetical protein [Phycisphaerae bacterium]
MNDVSGQQSSPPGSGIIETIQSLVVAFVLAMVFRGFVMEGFVIPTGSMAPTLMGQHVHMHSEQTGYDFSIDAGPVMYQLSRMQQGATSETSFKAYDPMLSTTRPIESPSLRELYSNLRMGDRVLVLKFLPPFFSPKRWDVTVFKNPTDPIGPAQNYIKRLVGLPREQLLIADGDIFTGPLDSDVEEFAIQRKPEYIQRAIWQPVYDSSFIPVDIQTLEASTRRAWNGPPWEGAGWDTMDARTYHWNSDAPTTLQWDPDTIPINDFTTYNMLRDISQLYPTSDLRLACTIQVDDPDGFSTSFAIKARSHIFTFMLQEGRVSTSIEHFESREQLLEKTADFSLSGSDGILELEFWHVDQCMYVFIDGEQILRAAYDDWSPIERIEYAHFGRTLEQYRAAPTVQKPTPPSLDWSFSGSSITLHNVRLDRDLYYRPGKLNPGDQFYVNNDEYIRGLSFGTDPLKPAIIGEGEYMMLGDNSAASRDSRAWGWPHQLVRRTFDWNTPFLVPRQLLVGKAWGVYWPSLIPREPGGARNIPDFGRWRFIR